MSMPKSQRPDKKASNRYTPFKAGQVGGEIIRLRSANGWVAFLEDQDAVSIVIPELSTQDISIWFGNANETWGASVMSVEGDDIAYLETFLDQNVVPATTLAAAAVEVVEAWLQEVWPILQGKEPYEPSSSVFAVMPNAGLFSVDTLHVEVPPTLDSALFNRWVETYCNTKGYEGVDDEDGGLKLEADRLESVLASIKDREPEPNTPVLSLLVFLKRVQLIIGDADEIYFYKEKVR